MTAHRRIEAVMRRHGVDPCRHGPAVTAALDHPTTRQLLALLERAARGEDVTAEGDEALRVALSIVLGLVEHTLEECLARDVAPSADVQWAYQGLLLALHHGPGA